MFEECISEDYKLSETGYTCCNCCGTLNPKELADLIKHDKVILREIEWKYGYPYAIEIDILNPNAKQIRKVGIRYYMQDGIAKEEVIMGTGTKYVSCKFYNHHLEYVDPYTFEIIASYFYKTAGIEFEIRQSKLYYYSACQMYKK